MVWDNPLRLEIQKRLSDALKEVTPGNGYVSDVSASVFRGRLIFGEGDPLPMVSILEAPIPLDQLEPPEDATLSSGRWELVVQGFVADDRQNPTDPAHVLLADVKKRLAVEKKKSLNRLPEDGILGLGRFVTNLYIGSGVVRPPDEISAKAYFWLTISLDLAEDLEEPYGP